MNWISYKLVALVLIFMPIAMTIGLFFFPYGGQILLELIGLLFIGSVFLLVSCISAWAGIMILKM